MRFFPQVEYTSTYLFRNRTKTVVLRSYGQKLSFLIRTYMLPLFEQNHKPRGAISLHPSVSRFKELVKINVTRLQDYYHSNVRAVRNSYPLVQAIKHMPSYTEDAVNLFNTASSRYPYLSKNLRFTTDFNAGSLTGHKVIPLSDNLIYSTSDYVRPYQAVQDWKTLRPIKLFWKDSAYMDMSVPDPYALIKDGLVAMTVDLPLLSLMYKGYKHEMDKTGLVLGEDQFIGTYLLPSVIESQVDMTCISAAIALYEGNHVTQSRVVAPIYLNSYASEFSTVTKHALNRIDGSRMQYNHMLQSIPTVYSESAEQALLLPSFAPTTQVEWSMLVSRLKIIDFLLEVGGKSGRDANRGFINILKVYCRDVQKARIPYSVMSDSLAQYVDHTLTKIANIK